MRGEKRSEPTYDLRLYNSATGKCDLSEEEARKREAYRQAESEAADRQRHERLERWRNTPLDPEAKQALGNVPPAAAWLELQDQVAGAFCDHPEEADVLLVKYEAMYQCPYDLEGLLAMMGNLNPVVGINNFQYLNEKVNLKDVMKSKPLDVLEQVLKMLTISDKWQSEIF
jgi:hypothetical protein